MGHRRECQRRGGQSASAARPHSKSAENEKHDWLLVRMADLLVVAVLMVNVVTTPRTESLSRVWLGNASWLPQILGGVIGSLATLVLLGYFLAAMAAPCRLSNAVKVTAVVLFSIFYLALPAISDMEARERLGIRIGEAYVSFPHDGGVLQTEAATKLLLAGENPYSAYYGSTEMAQSHHSNPEMWRSLGFKENPAFSFYPYPPLTFLLSVPAYVACEKAFGWFDERLIYLVMLAVAGVIAYWIPRENAFRLPLLCLVIVNPLAGPFFAGGYNDVLCVTLMTAVVWALASKRPLWAATFLGLACGAKQFAWLMVPFYLAYLVTQTKSKRADWKWLFDALRPSWPFWVVLTAVFLPFVVWDPAALWRGLVEGQGTLYPFRPESRGLSNLFIWFGWITSPRQAFPTVWLYVLLVLPAAAMGLWWTLRGRSLAAMLTGYLATLVLFLCCSRSFLSSYLWLVMTVAACAFVLDRQWETCNDSKLAHRSDGA